MKYDMTQTPCVENRATAECVQVLRDELLYHRATQTYLWALPLINTLGMQRGSGSGETRDQPRPKALKTDHGRLAEFSLVNFQFQDMEVHR